MTATQAGPGRAAHRRESFDYVVVGAGSAGCVLAALLSEDPGVQVLLLESGGADTAEGLAEPWNWTALLGSEVDWSYLTEEQEHAGGRNVSWPRGHVLGGSSSINAMVYVRGAASDFDSWASGGCPGWGYAEVLPSFRALETYHGRDSRWRGDRGPLHINRVADVSPLSRAAFEAAICLGYAFNHDPNAQAQSGVSWNQLTVRDSKRHSASAAFLHPNADRSNLTVRTGARASRVVVDRSMRATAVDYVHSGGIHTVGVHGEVVLACGAVETPKLLMLSGIGPADELRRHGIVVRLNSPFVGANLHDHPGVPIMYRATRPVPLGPNQGSELGLFCASRDGLHDPDLQFGLLTTGLAPDGPVAASDAFTFYPSFLRPYSRGHLRLKSARLEDHPLIDPQYLSDERDVVALIHAIEISRRIAATTPLRDWVASEAYPGPEVADRASMIAYVRSSVNTWFHPVGSARMGVGDDCVVDPDLRVYGVDGLRVADASVMPAITSGNTNAPTMMIAWRAADLIRTAHGT